MATSTIFNFNFNNSEIVDSTGQWYDATTGTPTTEFINHDGNTALLQRAYIAETSYLRDINPVFFQSRDPTFTAHTYTIELQIYPLRDSGGFGPWDGPVLEFNTESDERGWVSLVSVQRASSSNTFYWREYGLGPDGSGIPFLTVTAADGTYNRWYSIRIERVDDGTNTGATVKIYVDGTLVVNETLTYLQDARRGRIGNSIRYTYRRNSTSPEGAGVAIDNFKLTAGIAPSSVVDVSLANLQRNNANLLSFIKGKVPTVNDGTLTIQKNGANVATFTANQSTAATANITVPTAVSELTNDSGYLTSSSNLDASKLTSGTVDIARLPQGALERLIKVANEAARYALTTADVQLGDTVQQLDTGIMYIVTDADHLDSAAGYTEYTAGTAASVPWSGVTGKPTFAAVATSGAYSDLTGTPTIPTVNDATLTIQKNGTDVATFSANSSTNATANITVPTKTSDLTNDSGFITSDNTKIPLAGSNAISGSLIPSTDNSIDVGSSTKNIKRLYTKGITIDAKTIDTDANGNMTYDSHIVDTIEEQGDGYIRYSNGIQICWGSLSVAIGISFQYDSLSTMYYARGYTFNYPKGFSSIPVVSLCVFTGNSHPFLQVCAESSADNIDEKLTTGSIMLSCKCATTIRQETSIHIQAIGRWK